MQKSRNKSCKCCGEIGAIYKHGLIRKCYDKKKQEEVDLYYKIWKTRRRIDFETRKSIYGEIKLSYFHHVLPKAKYPEYRLCLWNIVLVSDLTHAQAELDIRKTPLIQSYTNMLKFNHELIYDTCKDGEIDLFLKKQVDEGTNINYPEG